MMNHVIDAKLTTQSLTFRPGNPVTFGVVAINRSEQFAAFELEILAAAGDRESWYRLSPEVSAAKPPGDRTEFQVEILASPIAYFVGDINLTVKVSSPQLATERRLVLRLTVEPGEKAPLLSVTLPRQRLQVYPRNTIDIPVEVENLGLRSTEVVLDLKDIDITWTVGTAERRLQLEAGQQAEISFQCRPPGASQAASQDYPFTVVARNREGATVSTAGILEVLPVGFVQFEVQPSQQRLPAKSSQLRHWLSNIAIFQLQFKNASNLLQKVAIELRGKDCQSCQFQVDPENADLPLATETSVKLSVKVKRPWIGRVKRLQIEAKAWLSNQILGSTDPTTQVLTLKVFPIVPTWLLLILLALLSALLAVILQPSISHLATVNVVRFSGTSGRFPLVLSGADDCTIRSWTTAPSWLFAKPETLRPQGELAEDFLNTVCSSRKPESKGLLAVLGQAVRALELIPVNNNQVFAGLENGEIQAWDVNTGRKQYSLKDSKDKTGDRVLSLAFTQNSRYLYSGYGSGTVRKWQIPPRGQSGSNPQPFTPPAPFQFQVWAIALSPDEKVLISTGQFKRLLHWDLSQPGNPRPTQISLSSQFGNQGENDFFWSIAFAPKSHLLATADSDGYITLWDLQKCQMMKSNYLKYPSSQLPQTKCEISDRWQASPADVRSIRFTPDGRRLVSAGDDGQIVAWAIAENKKHDPTQKQIVASLSRRIASIDLVANQQRTLIASGGEDFQVRLHLLK
ncbi:hypothetical protein H6G17_25070 [Chroococcidiopsis sp. FACHB-1243]|uniref:hypothetical protein n=1 Tax=Chroococcidiopsis sp. [FACHB-1243] TaxID=2692781 RepID=UPI001783CD6C|nr:hypothetical protein [Chroococcidiopsis sp. [FACHB-1243]]MBD2308745.1 hypothetical protein [Chroococcidiopsis sp. [FACHB-1243]]